jgi:hypothetical protein
VTLAAAAMPRWKGRWGAAVRLSAAPFNELDGFSTLAPILFKLDGIVTRPAGRIHTRCR